MKWMNFDCSRSLSSLILFLVDVEDQELFCVGLSFFIIFPNADIRCFTSSSRLCSDCVRSLVSIPPSPLSLLSLLRHLLREHLSLTSAKRYSHSLILRD